MPATSHTFLYDLTNIRKDYTVGQVIVTALTEVSIRFNDAEFVALQGPSGSGKSTLLNVLGLLEVPSSGTLHFMGKNLTGRTDVELTEIRRHNIGFIFQNFNLVSTLTALENVEYPLFLEGIGSRKEIESRGKEALRAVGLEKFVQHKPRQLSGGQRQRVAIARALVKNPKVILADEPTANLDSKNASQIVELMHELKTKFNTSVVVATHDSKIAAGSDRRIQLIDGKIESISETTVPESKHSAPRPQQY